MPGLKEVKNRIKSITSTQQITKAMKMVAASKLRRAQDKILQMKPFSEKLSNLLNNSIIALEGEYQSEYATVREAQSVMIVPITSDRGLCGAFNSNIFRKVRDLLEQEYAEYYQKNKLVIMPMGRKCFEFYRKRGFSIIDKYWGVFQHLSFDQVQEAAEYLMNGFKKEEFDKVVIVYNEFKNVATQILKVEQYLPLAQNRSAVNPKMKSNYIFEPKAAEIIKELIPKSLAIQLFKNILESNASEHGARMTAMDQATENADDLLNDLTLTYNRTRQSAITKEINEIVGGANALG